MSTFSGLSTALSSLIAQRQALDVAGQNVANANTVGYTRQRADLASVAAQSAPSMFSTGLTVGNGTTVSGITRMGDVFLDARVRAETGGASLAASRADTYSQIESTVAEPGDTGVSNALQEFWAGWSDVGNTPGSTATRNVLLADATALTQRISAGYNAITTQWSQSRTQLEAAVVDVNSTATQVATLNGSIRGVLASGGSANELIDQRDVLVTKLSAAIGASATERADGTVDVMVGGNALVRGSDAQAIALNPNSHTMGSQISLSWATSGYPLDATAGTIVGLVTALAPVADGGILTGAAKSYDGLATALITQVNAAHHLAESSPGVAGGDFFTATAPGSSAAGTLSVAITDPALVAVAKPGGGALDGSMADTISQIGTQAAGPDATWSAFVVDLGVKSSSATQSATITESTRSNAAGLQLSNASVDLDEESTNMLAFQRAYEGAARVLTAIDQMLDTLINRTGVVGIG